MRTQKGRKANLMIIWYEDSRFMCSSDPCSIQFTRPFVPSLSLFLKFQ